MTPRPCPPSPAPDEARDPDEALARVAAALGHPTRVRILRFLLERDECFAGAIVEHLPLAQSTVSQHLKVLREAGLVRGEVEGPRVSYCADQDAIARLGAGLADLLSAGTPEASGSEVGLPAEPRQARSRSEPPSETPCGDLPLPGRPHASPVASALLPGRSP